VVSCLVHDVRYEWGLEPVDDGSATRITVLIEIPEAEAAHLGTQRDLISRSVARLAELATRT
jgi:hypothetical protein